MASLGRRTVLSPEIHALDNSRTELRRFKTCMSSRVIRSEGSGKNDPVGELKFKLNRKLRILSMNLGKPADSWASELHQLRLKLDHFGPSPKIPPKVYSMLQMWMWYSEISTLNGTRSYNTEDASRLICLFILRSAVYELFSPSGPRSG